MRCSPTRHLLMSGIVGLTIGLVLNSLAWFVLGRPSAHYFSPEWWSAWFPNYLAWLVIALTGMAVRPRLITQPRDRQNGS